jgi:response regulator RpfG family c-di-GMP phosphodiesterase
MATSERILFIDDEMPVRAAFARTVQRSGLEIDVAATAGEALALAESTSYAVIATDYRMPGVNGLELATRLESLQPFASLMLVTGECDLSLAVEAVNEHGIGYLVTKPWDGPELTALLRRAIAAHQERTLQTEMQRCAIDQRRALDEQKQRLQRALAESGDVVAEMLLNTLDLRHHETRAHCRRVATYARMLAQGMDITEPTLTSIYHGALLHDVGKIGVPDGILLKPGPLTPEEWAMMRQHSAMGAKLLEGLDGLAGAREIVLQHHERWDGTGYPSGFAGTRICIGARIFSVVDALDAMLSRRPYREPMTLESAFKQIVVNGGSQFDPQVVEAFLRIPRGSWLEVRATFGDEDMTKPSGQQAA